MKKNMRYLQSVAVPLGLIIIWQATSLAHIFSPLLLPSPEQVIRSLWELLSWNSGNIWPDILATLARVLFGLILGIIIGLPGGLLMGYFKIFHNLFGFAIDFLRSIPPPAILPLFMLFFGIGNITKIILAIFVVSLIILISAIYGVSNCQPTRLMVAKSLRLSKWSTFRSVIFPDALPHITTGLRTALSFSIIVVIVSEMLISADRGLGRRIIDFQLVYETSKMYAVIILTGFMGYGLNRMYIFFEAKKLHWIGK